MTRITGRNRGENPKTTGNKRVSRRAPVRPHVVELLAEKMAKAILDGRAPVVQGGPELVVMDYQLARRALAAARAFNREVYGRDEVGATRRGKRG